MTIVTKYINNINLETKNMFSIVQMSNDDLFTKVFNVNPKHGKSFNEICIEQNIKLSDYITTFKITNKNTYKLSKIVKALYKIKFDFNCEYVQDPDSFKKTDIKKLRNDNYIISVDQLKLFIYSGAFHYYLLLVNNNKHGTIGSICNHNYCNFYKYKDGSKDITNVRCLTNYDPIAKIICRYYHYMINNSMKDFDNDVIRSISSRENKSAFSKIISTIMFFKTKLFHDGEKVVLLDISKAFDNVNRDVLDLVLSKFTLPRYLIDYIHYIFSVNEKRSGYKSVHGIQQGNAMSSILFDMYHYIVYMSIKNQLPDNKMMFFVDDIALYFPKDTKNEYIYSSLQTIINVYKQYGLEINELKTQYINIEHKETSKAFKTQYLGVPISNKLDDVLCILNKNYGKELLSLLNDNDIIKYLKKRGDIDTILYNERDITIKKSIYYLSLSLSWRLMYFDSKKNTSVFERKLKKTNMFLYNVYMSCNNDLIGLKEKMPLLETNNISILDKDLLTFVEDMIEHADIPYLF
jgi:hypothetical protein